VLHPCTCDWGYSSRQHFTDVKACSLRASNTSPDRCLLGINASQSKISAGGMTCQAPAGDLKYYLVHPSPVVVQQVHIVHTLIGVCGRVIRPQTSGTVTFDSGFCLLDGPPVSLRMHTWICLCRVWMPPVGFLFWYVSSNGAARACMQSRLQIPSATSRPALPIRRPPAVRPHHSPVRLHPE
jgi:hypothetical protein